MNIIDFQAFLPLVILAAGSVILLLIISFARSFTGAFVFTAATHVAALLALGVASAGAPHRLEPLFSIDAPGILLQGIIIFASLIISGFAFDYFRKFDDNREEFFVLLLVATLGGAALATSNHFISFFLSLELLSVPIYALAAYTVRRNSALEAGIKYLILAAAATAFLLFGMGLLYVSLGTMEFGELGYNLSAVRGILDSGVILVGFAFIIAAMGFKLSLVPFHWWTPDVYQGAPAPVAALLATVSKAAVVAVALRFFNEIFILPDPAVFNAVGVLIFLSILVGNLLALGQSNLKRLLAYSSIAHMGYLFIAFLVGGSAGVSASIIYLLGYVLTSLGTFGVLSALSTSEHEVEEIRDLRGLHFRKPFQAALLTLFMLSLAGIPLTAGFIGKFFVLSAGAIDLEVFLPLLLTLVAGSAIGLFYYLRVVWTLYKPLDDDLPVLADKSTFSMTGVTLAAAAILIVGVFPSPLLEILQNLN